MMGPKKAKIRLLRSGIQPTDRAEFPVFFSANALVAREDIFEQFVQDAQQGLRNVMYAARERYTIANYVQ